MIWLSIILSILEAMPTLIALFKEIWAAVHPSPAKVHALTTLLLKHKDVTTASSDAAKAAVEADLRAFHALHVGVKS